MYGETKRMKQISPAEARDKRLQKTRDNNPKEKQQGFIQQFNGKQVKLTLASGEVLSGELHTDFYNKYEYLLEEKEQGTVIIRKDAVAYIKLRPGAVKVER